MLTIEQALERILADVPRTGIEAVSLEQALGRILAEDVRSPREVPPWDNSAMDGYAVQAADVQGEARLRVLETIGAGGWGRHRVEPGTASAIMTGAPMPEGADAVVMVEDTDGSREGHVVIRATAAPGQHVRPKGGDVRTGDHVLAKGDRIGPAAVGMLASLGLTGVTVAARPVVAILSTGDEVVPPGRPLAPGQIYSSNNHAIAAQLVEAGAIPRDMGNAPDEPDALLAQLGACVKSGVDAVITTGGVSVGAFDYVKDAFARLGGEVDFWKVRMKPGKPLAYGHIGEGRRVPLFGLPGNPVSCMVNFLQFVRPWLLTAMGSPRPFLPVVEAFAGEDLLERPGRVTLVRVRLELGEGGLVCWSTGSQSSNVLTSMLRGHGFALIAADSEGVRAGECVRVQIYDGSFGDRADPGFGW